MSCITVIARKNDFMSSLLSRTRITDLMVGANTKKVTGDSNKQIDICFLQFIGRYFFRSLM